MRLEAREVASLVTATGDAQIVVIFTSGDATEFHLARRSFYVRASGGGK